MKTIITSESVNKGHPDKTCDIIADAFLDEALRQDVNSQMAVECAIKNNKLFIYGEMTSNAKIDFDKIAQEILKSIGYNCDFDIIKEISLQSPDINKAVVKDNHLFANDQGIIFGYATNETKEYMPLPILVAHKLMQQYEKFRLKNKNYYSDAKSQVSLEYEDDRAINFNTIVLSASHNNSLSLDTIRKELYSNVILPVLNQYKDISYDKCRFLVNPSGTFTIWGSFGDSGCVGRKIIVDTYGGIGKVGGGCFSSKNATKVDRSAAYYARYVAKNIVAHKLADKCEISVSYGIGIERALNININTFGTNKVDMEKIYDIVNKNFDFSLENIINELDLLKPIYQETACYGHFGREKFSWERIKDIKI